ncbi:MAG: S53 family peptidase [Jatrophihabitans sp.]
MVSAVCPQCHILLVEATNASMENLGASVNTAVSMGVKYVSNSYGGGEDGSEGSYDSSYFDHPGVAITASTGDGGYGISYPASSPYVTAVGGTSLSRDSSSRGWTESAWDGAGGGCSSSEAKPDFQTDIDTGCGNRADADVSAVADPNTGVAVYDTYGASGWQVYGGTSASSPIIASVYALAGTPGRSDIPNSYPYADRGDLNDVTAGSNGSCSASQQCNAGTGWDGPTGLGTPNGVAAFAPTG